MLEEDPFTRMKMVVRWYLSGFYKKPKVSVICCAVMQLLTFSAVALSVSFQQEYTNKFHNLQTFL